MRGRGYMQHSMCSCNMLRHRVYAKVKCVSQCRARWLPAHWAPHCGSDRRAIGRSKLEANSMRSTGRCSHLKQCSMWYLFGGAVFSSPFSWFFPLLFMYVCVDAACRCHWNLDDHQRPHPMAVSEAVRAAKRFHSPAAANIWNTYILSSASFLFSSLRQSLPA